LAGGIELFSTSNITYMEGKGELGTLISSRLLKYYGTIVKDIDRVQLGYELIKLLNKATEDQPGAEYYELLEHAYAALDDNNIDLGLIRAWFSAQLLRMAGHTPNLRTDTAGDKLSAGARYNFDSENMVCIEHKQGRFDANHIKTMRLLFDGHAPKSLMQVTDLQTMLNDISPLIKTMLTTHIRV
jgi:recombinational DNA repair protein (RecF pathway)